MKIIISRKGFDTSIGCTPSPIFPSNRMISLPIPDNKSNIQYKDLNWHEDGYSISEIIEHLTKGKIKGIDYAHLDPDLIQSIYKRQKGWKPVFGTNGSAQAHLSNHQIQQDDIFLFFGLFQRVQKTGTGYSFNARYAKHHTIFGWLQIDEIVPIDSYRNDSKLSPYSYHPHINTMNDKRNYLYVAKENLSINENPINNLSGSGFFKYYDDKLRLSAFDTDRFSIWKLPKWFYPEKIKEPLTYHSELNRWHLDNDSTYLKTVGRGQEFIIDCNQYPESVEWLLSILNKRSL